MQPGPTAIGEGLGERRSPTDVQLSAVRHVAACLAWGITLLAVGLPQVVLDLRGLAIPGWLAVADLVLVLGAAALSLAWRPLRPLARYFVVLAVIQPAIHPSLWPAALGSLHVQLPAGSPQVGGELIRELCVAVVVGAFLLITVRRGPTFLAAGNLRATAAPVRWLIDRPISWLRLGPASAVAIGLGTLAFVVIGGTIPATDAVLAALPGVVAIAGLNALNEEVAFRAGPLATVRDILGDRQATLLLVALFAVPHYFGVPFGLVGVVMAGIFAWWVTKCILETRGLFWAWVIHVLQDIVIFGFVVTGSIT